MSVYTDPQYWSVRLELPSSAVCCVCVRQLRLPELRGSAAGKHTPHGRKKLQRGVGSYEDTNTVGNTAADPVHVNSFNKKR